MARLNPYPVTEDAVLVVKALLEAEPESFDPAREIARLTTYACPECGGKNTTNPDEEGLVDCLDCGIWFHPLHPRNKHALRDKPEGTICQSCGRENVPCRAVRDTYSFLNPSKEKYWLCDRCFRRERQKKRGFWNDFYSGTGAGEGMAQRGYGPRDLEHEVAKWRKIGESLDPETEAELLAYAMAQGEMPVIRITYGIITPESAEEGDYAETGWEDREGVQFSVDEIDKADGITVVDKVVEYLKNRGAHDASSSHFHQGVWYTSHEDDFRTGNHEELSYHLNGFTEQQERAIFELLMGRK